MRAYRWISDDGKFDSTIESEVLEYEERQKNVLAWLDLPWALDTFYEHTVQHFEAVAGLLNLTPRWLAFFQLHTQLMNDGDMGKWKQRMVIEIDALEQEFMGIVREPKVTVREVDPLDPKNVASALGGSVTPSGHVIIFADHRDNELQAREDAER